LHGSVHLPDSSFDVPNTIFHLARLRFAVTP
jgi:hypothetical protein